MMADYVDANPNKAALFSSLGTLRYLSVMKYVTAVVGNSSSGIVEAPGAPTATINIGDRQKGRIQAESIVNCIASKKEILYAFEQVKSSVFQDKVRNSVNPYGNGTASQQIIEVLKSIEIGHLKKKSFYDILR